MGPRLTRGAEDLEWGALLEDASLVEEANLVRDIAGKLHPFETDENTLYELDIKGELSFPEFYRIIT